MSTYNDFMYNPRDEGDPDYAEYMEWLDRIFRTDQAATEKHFAVLEERNQRAYEERSRLIDELTNSIGLDPKSGEYRILAFLAWLMIVLGIGGMILHLFGFWTPTP